MSSKPWFRMYTEFASDPKVQRLDETLQRRFIMLLCLAGSGVTPTNDVSDIDYVLRIGVSECEKTRCILVSKGLITDDWFPVKWGKRQFASDSSTARVKRFRDRSKGVTSAVTETPSEQSRTDTEQNRADRTRAREGAESVSRETNTKVADAEGNGRRLTPEAELAIPLIEAGVKVSSMHPDLVAWVRDGFTLEQCQGALAIARQSKPVGPIHARYLDTILRDPRPPPANGKHGTAHGAWARMEAALGGDEP